MLLMKEELGRRQAKPVPAHDGLCLSAFNTSPKDRDPLELVMDATNQVAAEPDRWSVGFLNNGVDPLWPSNIWASLPP